MPPAGFEPAIPANERPQTHALSPRGYWVGHVYDFEGKTKACFRSRKIEKNYMTRKFIIFILRLELKSSINQGTSISEIRKAYEGSVEADSSSPSV